MAKKGEGVTYENVATVIQNMLNSGVNPSVKAIRDLSGGKTEIVSRFKNEFFDKRDMEVSMMADELGSSNIASLLADEMQMVVDRKTSALSDIVARQKEQLKEVNELMDEKESDCIHRIELAQAEAHKATQEAEARIEANHAQLVAAQDAKTNAEKQMQEAQKQANSAVEDANKRAEALVHAANIEKDKAQTNVAKLESINKSLLVDQAKHELKAADFEQNKKQLADIRVEFAESKTLLVKAETQKLGLEKDVMRLESDLSESKIISDKLSAAQAQLVELQKQLSQAQHDLAQSEREKQSLSQALSASS